MITIPVQRYQPGQPLRFHGRYHRYHQVRVIGVAHIAAGYDRVRAACSTCVDSWTFLHHWGRWQ